METLIQIGKLLLLLSASALCVYIIVALIRLNALMDVLQREIIDLNKNLKPILENLNTISEKLRMIASKVDDQVNMVHGVFIAFKRITDNIICFEERIQQSLEEPLMRVSSLFSNIINRLISLFMRRSKDIF